MLPLNVNIFLKKGLFSALKKSAFFLKWGYFGGKSQCKGGFFLHLENTDGLPLTHESGAAGVTWVSSVI